MRKSVLRAYARLIARSGVNIQKGQEVFIAADLDQPEFVAMLVDECYKCKAKKVVVDWNYQPLQKLHVRHRSLTTLSRVEDYELARWQHYVDTIPCRIYLLSEDPDGLKGIDQDEAGQEPAGQVPHHQALPGQDREPVPVVHCRCARRGVGEEAVPRSAEIAGGGEAVGGHSVHLPCAGGRSGGQLGRPQRRHPRAAATISTACTSASCATKAPTGTDFTVGMIPQAHFCGGSEKSLQGIVFNPNIPTEECFISPKRGEAEGIVYATKPLSYQGQLIDGFWIRFHEGKAVEWHAEQNNDLLTKLITMDEGSAYLGECALVPYDSPIRQSGLLFYNTLFDENAACHLALGTGFADTINDFESRTLEECRALGVNDSMIHEDFMIGSEDMDIDAVCEDGKVVPIFRHGNWAF